MLGGVWGAGEAIIKGGDNSCIIVNDEGRMEVAPPAKLKPVDTTGAGDSFAAGYIGMRIQNKSVDEAARMAHAIAAKVIMHPGGAHRQGCLEPGSRRRILTKFLWSSSSRARSYAEHRRVHGWKCGL